MVARLCFKSSTFFGNTLANKISGTTLSGRSRCQLWVAKGFLLAR